MEKRKKIWIIILIVLLFLAALYLLFVVSGISGQVVKNCEKIFKLSFDCIFSIID